MENPNNTVTDRAYFTRRLRNSGWAVDTTVDRYTPSDKRLWTVVVSRNHSNVLITCRTDGTFSFYDGHQFFDGTLNRETNHSTKSMEVIQTILVTAGINEKHPSYGEKNKSEEKST